MPGMQSGIGVSNALIVEAFRSALRQQLIIVAVIFLALWLARLIALRSRPIKSTAGTGTSAGKARTGSSAGKARTGGSAGKAQTGGSAGKARTGEDAPTGTQPEPSGRRLLRIGFAILWIFDGILQAQPAMPIGMPAQVIKPTAASSPAWVQHVVNAAGTVWTYHPIQISAAAVWIQVGIGLWLLFARRGPWARLGALASVGWGLLVWVFGESFGGIFAPGLTWLFGAPGAVLLYCAAGALLALPEDAWRTPRLGRLILAGTGVFFIGMAVLQAWPGRGFWQGNVHGQPGTLTGMIRSMSQTPQPHFLARIVASFANFTAAHGFAVNLFTVIALAAIGAAFLSGQPRLARLGVGAALVLCLADWVLIEDLGFLGGVGTDPNSMIPTALLFASGYLAMTRVPEHQAVPAAEPAKAAGKSAAPQPAKAAGRSAGLEPAKAAGKSVAPQTARATGPRGRLADLLQSGLRSLTTASGRSIAAVGALGVVLVGVVPSAAASANRNADPIIAQAIGGASNAANLPAPGFSLTDQHGSRVSLASLRGKVVLLTFFDPVCTSDCPLIGHEFAAAARLLAADTGRIQLAAVVLSPTYRSLAAVQAFDRQEGLSRLPNWLYMTGTLAELQNVWRAYGMTAQDIPAGGMSLHNDAAYVIDRNGRVRQIINTDPGPGTAASQSSFSVELADAARQLLGSA
jgi:cytochrome oxidase Cu insertion factor (SCO1/SenC/PrrC family)